MSDLAVRRDEPACSKVWQKKFIETAHSEIWGQRALAMRPSVPAVRILAEEECPAPPTEAATPEEKSPPLLQRAEDLLEERLMV